MIPIRLAETERDDFEGTIVELWRQDDFIGMVFWDGEAPIVQIYPDNEGDVYDLDLNELLRLLDTALAMVDPGGEDEFSELREAVAETNGENTAEHPATTNLLSVFDPQAVYRSDDGEGFFPRLVAEAFITSCEEMDLAVVEMEGFDLEGATLVPRPQLDLQVRPQEGMTWSTFRSFANKSAQDTVRSWPRRDSLVVAFVFQQPDAEIIVA